MLSTTQALGSRKSYHIAPPKEAIEFLSELDQTMGDDRHDVSVDVNFSHLSVCIGVFR